VGGVPVTLATNQAQPSEIVVDDRNIYWLDSTDDGAVMVLAKDAGPARPEIMVVATIFGGVSSFTLDATSGVPTAAPRSPVDPGIQLYAVAAHPSGDFVYGADFRGRIYGYRVNRGDGSLDSLSGLPLIIGGQAVSAAVDPLGRFLYVGNNGDNNLYAFTIAPSTGALTPATGSPFALGATPAGVAFAPSGAFAYISTGPSATDGGGIHVFTVDGTSGKPTELATSPFVQTLFAGALVMHPSGKFLYDTAFGVHALSIDPTTGAVTGEMAGSPHPGASSDNQAIDVALDPGGGHLYASAQAGTVTAYSIDTTTGVFGSVPGSPFAAGTLPYALAVDPTGRFVYVGNDDAQQVSVFSIAPGNGALQPVGQPITVPGLQPEIVIIRSEP
jgi:6-phosphogluconolactonase (cycloisomerase 2 family)